MSSGGCCVKDYSVTGNNRNCKLGYCGQRIGVRSFVGLFSVDLTLSGVCGKWA